MNKILVLITLSDSGIETIKSTPELPKKENELLNQWREQKILESFYISVSKKSAVLIFKNIDENKATELIKTLPYFPYMATIDYNILNQIF
ncbi:MAG: hypothetical protein JST62_01475 [Bacteroidetes bacterium]|nr:hypothetical protein [Bacteroidota bacterium]